MIVIAVVALIAEWLLTTIEGPVADRAPGDYRQRMIADTPLILGGHHDEGSSGAQGPDDTVGI
jgi:hypothetical protein